MGRIKGMRKIDGKWYRPEQIAAMGIVVEAPVSVCGPDIMPGVDEGTIDTLPSILDVPSAVSEHSSITPPKLIQGTHVYSPEQIKGVEVQTGLVYAGSFANIGTADLVPVFLRADHSEEERRGKMVSIRKGM